MDNVCASKMGQALNIAEKSSYGDNIDRGLALFNELDRLGFIINVRPEAAVTAMQHLGRPLSNGETRYTPPQSKHNT